MKYLSDFFLFKEGINLFNEKTKSRIISKLNETIDDAFLPLIDMGFKFENGHDKQQYYDIIRVYKRFNSVNLGLNIIGKIFNSKIVYDDSSEKMIDFLRMRNDKKVEIINELEEALYIISGISGIDLNFSLTNFYEEDKIIISVKI